MSLASQQAPRILLIRLSSLGDVVHSMAAVQDIRRAYPTAQIDWVVESAFAPLVARCEGVQRVIPCALQRWRKNYLSAVNRSEWLAFKAELQAQAYDVVIDLQGLTASVVLAWLAQTRVGGLRYAMANGTEGARYQAPTRWLADRSIPVQPRAHAVEQARVLCAGALGYSVDAPATFGLRGGSLAVVQPQVRAKHKMLANPGAAVNPFVPRKPVVALLHGSKQSDKAWPLAHWTEIGQRLNHAGFCVALPHGNAAEKAVSEKIAAGLDDAWLWPSMALDALTDTLARCAGTIGVDSSISGIAAALDLPHVQIYNCDTRWRTGVSTFHQVSVFVSPSPSVDAVWQAWDGLDTPQLCQ